MFPGRTWNVAQGRCARLTLLAFGTLFCGLASASTITIGNGTSGNSAPFSAYLGEYQQVYNGALFSGPVYITEITFFGSAFSGYAGISGTFTLDLSTTKATTVPGGISDIYSANIGADNAQFFSGTVTNGFSFAGGPFLYDPSKGNLLLDVNALSTDPNQSFLAAGCSTDTNRVATFGGTTFVGLIFCTPSAPPTYGLETEFTYVGATATTPEPSTLLMLATGLLLLVGAKGYAHSSRGFGLYFCLDEGRRSHRI